ncbi:tannase/feruloyl esterase family alpha/beta hydrolase [Rouxiella badensis]|uniref:tannase/feruloyl esterase family alpha/beta hydrolase n=1 Tax=Rouxiella badensis TaxID=1646377 RepID=UPI0022AAEBA2|nr:tannase/feruloyl esterase family alpha/beta hydrolase [Rouxiella badensis]WAT10482.1 tannase/feruloyl esterase family alpha/beta hydrolase [Rouxiella badensis]
MISKSFTRLWQGVAVFSLFTLVTMTEAAQQNVPASGPSKYVTNQPAAAVTSLTPAGLILPAVKSVIDCSALTKTDLTALGGEGSHIISAKETQTNGSPFCQVDGVLSPAVGFRVMLPTTRWIQRYMQIGCGGLCGSIRTEVGAAAGCTPLNANGFVIGATDMGHGMDDDAFGNSAQKRVDFAYRAQHLTALVSKQLIAAYYGRGPSYSYFNGCSDGGREALMEAQRYPDDFNGIIAGAPAMNLQVQNAIFNAWLVLANTGAEGKPVILSSRLPLIHNAVLAQCDAEDGQVDGLISDPQSCHFDPQVLSCKAGSKDTQNCLSEAEITALRKIYEGPKDPQSGQKLIVGGPMPGSELAWGASFIPATADAPNFSKTIALNTLQYLAYVKNPSKTLTLNDVQFNKVGLSELAKLHPLYDATNPDLKAFYEAGGKLILWHGWADGHISPANTLAYHQALADTMGGATRDKFERLYLFPGMHHCSGGEGPSQMDLLSPMMNWVEQGIAPDVIISYQAAQKVTTRFGQPGGAPGKGAPQAVPPRSQGITLETLAQGAASRPVYPYPFYAVYSGKGDVNSAASYKRKRLKTVPTQYPWLGQDFFKPYQFIE